MATDPKTPYDAETYDKTLIRIDIAGQMIKGAILASVVLVGPAAFIYVIYLIGTLLPPDSKEAEDPTPDSFSFYEAPLEQTATVGPVYRNDTV